MNLAMELIQQIDNPELTYTERARLRCKFAKELEEAGNYEAARSVMGELWQQVGTRPNLAGLETAVAADVLLRAGALSGWLGSAHQIEKAQDIAKDLISESITLFESLRETEKVAEAYIDLAICYWREGAFDEARVTLREVLERTGNESGEQKARALLNSAVVEISTVRFNDALRILTEAAPLFDENRNHAAKGRFHGQLALVLKKLGTTEHREDYIDRALIEYSAASYHYEQAGHSRYSARVENNLGFLLFTIGKLPEAHQHLDRAFRLFDGLKDSGSIAQVNETRARVFLAQGRNAEAEKVSRVAVRTLGEGDELSLLAEALTTHGVALARLGRSGEARQALERAMEAAEHAGDNAGAGAAAITIIEEMGERLAAEEMRAFYERADVLLAGSQNTETLGRLRAAARRVLEAGRARVEEHAAQSFVYADQRTAELMRTAHIVAGTQGTVLITGETGTGKEVLARLVHQWSGRAGQFVVVNCGALTETRIESLLFGHRSGSFADAVQDHAGAVREAAGGTLFLDEISELSTDNQGKLLRLIERGEIHPVGAPTPERVDVRIIAATNRDLKECVAHKQFRNDLLYRINTFHLVIPPLRERPEDIPALAAHFIKELTELHARRVEFTPEAIEAMRGLQLKGNARELRALIERTMLRATEGVAITREAVEIVANREVGNISLSAPWEGFSIKEEVRRYEANLVRMALEASGGSVTHAARLLGITHQRLGSMLEGRHKSLLVARKPALRRKSSVITKLRHEA